MNATMTKKKKKRLAAAQRLVIIEELTNYIPPPPKVVQYGLFEKWLESRLEWSAKLLKENTRSPTLKAYSKVSASLTAWKRLTIKQEKKALERARKGIKRKLDLRYKPLYGRK